MDCSRNDVIFSFSSIYYRLLMGSTHGHEDRVRYWLTEAVGKGQPIPCKVFMVTRRPYSKVYCFFKLSKIFLRKDERILIAAFLSRPLRGKFSVTENINPAYNAKRRLRCTHSEVHTSKCRLGQS